MDGTTRGLTHLRNASTTMKMTRSKTGDGRLPYSLSSNVASPGMNGLYGKKPLAKRTSARGKRIKETSVAALEVIKRILEREAV